MPVFRPELPTACCAALISALTCLCLPAFGGETNIATVTQTPEAICSDTMRLKPGYVQYGACVESLSKVLAARQDQEKYVLAYRDCANAQSTGNAEFSACVLDRTKPDGVDERAPGLGAMSYLSSNADERRALQERACAKLGLIPGQAGFTSCVIGLQVNIESASNPS